VADIRYGNVQQLEIVTSTDDQKRAEFNSRGIDSTKARRGLEVNLRADPEIQSVMALVVSHCNKLVRFGLVDSDHFEVIVADLDTSF
jgi:hypothetical protein